MSLRHPFFMLPVLAVAAASCANSPSVAQAVPSRLSFDFNSGASWKNAKAYASSPALTSNASWQKVGSYNEAGTANQSGGWRMRADASRAKKAWSAGFSSGPIALRNSETNLGKLTLAFTLSSSAARPVKVKIASLDATGKRLGGLETLIYPAAPDFLQRFALELNGFKASGAGKFDPKAPQIQLAFEIDGATWPQSVNELRVDDVNLSGPAFYVSPNGLDTNDGKTEQTAFATPQKAVDVAGPGDIILLMKGTYRGELRPVASFVRAGTPAAWIVLKNYPGQKPTLSGNGWNHVHVSKGSKAEPDETTELAYLEVRGLHVRGEGDVAKEKYPDAIGKSDSRTNSNGITIDGRFMKNVPHHVRFADNIVEFCPGGGIGTIEGDWVQIEGNISRFNCWTMIYGGSGMGTLGASNFDAAQNVYKMLIRNNTVYRNETFIEWEAVKHISDGNGIIIDVNRKTSSKPDSEYLGRTLIQSNLVFDNGGSGIHVFKASRVDIVNNTAYLNSASKALEYGQIFGNRAQDVRIFNNIMVAPVANVAAGEKPESVNNLGGPAAENSVVYANNLYFGGNTAPLLGQGDRIADPQFIKPTRDGTIANFRLQPGSPALGAGKLHSFGPFLDLTGKPRGQKPDLGAYQH